MEDIKCLIRKIIWIFAGQKEVLIKKNLSVKLAFYIHAKFYILCHQTRQPKEKKKKNPQLTAA